MNIEFLARCHCGALTARYRTVIMPSAWSVRACQCSFCRAHGAISTSDPQGSLIFAAADESLLQRYRFTVRLADFLLCRQCGVYLGAQLESPKGRFGVLNVRALRPIPAEIPAPESKDYHNESLAERLARREALWTPLAPESL